MATKSICTMCGSDKAQMHYYKSNSEIYRYNGRITVCKDCVNELYEKYLKELKSDVKAMYKLAMKIDIYFDMKLFETSKEKHEDANMTLPIYYLSKVGLIQYKGKTFSDSDMIDIWSKDKAQIHIESKKEESKVTQEMIKRWGRDRSEEDYLYLEEKYEELISVYDHKMPTQRWSYETIVKTKLEAEKALEREDYIMYDKLTDRVQKLMNDSNIKPIQQDNSDDIDANLPGKWAKIIQEKQPIPEAEGVFKDVDGIAKMFDNQFVRTMKSIVGVD